MGIFKTSGAVMCLLAASHAVAGFNWAAATVWNSDGGGDWNSNLWTGGVPDKDKDVALGYVNVSTPRPFSGRVNIHDYAASARNLLLRGSLSMNNGQLDIYGDVDCTGGGGFDIRSSRLSAMTSSTWKSAFIHLKNGVSYLEVWTGQTLTLDQATSIISMNGGDIRQSRALYRPGSIVNRGGWYLLNFEEENPTTVELTGKSFTNYGTISASGIETEGYMDLAYEEIQSPGFLEIMDGFTLNAYTSDETKEMVLGKLTVQDFATAQFHMKKVKFGGDPWKIRYDGQVLLHGSELNLGMPGTSDIVRNILPTTISLDSSRSLRFIVPGGETGVIKGGSITDSALRRVTSLGPNGYVPTRFYLTQFTNDFRFSGNDFIFDQCDIGQFTSLGSRFEIRNFDIGANAHVVTSMITTSSWGANLSYWYSNGDVSMLGVVDVMAPLVLANRGANAVKFINRSSLSVQSTLEVADKATLVNDGGSVNVLANGQIPDMVTKNGGVVLVGKYAGITGALTAESNAFVSINPPNPATQPGAPFEGFTRGLNIKPTAVLSLNLGTVKPNSTFMKSHGVTLGGNLVIDASQLPSLPSGTTIDVIQGPTVYGTGFTVDPVPGWTVATSPIGVWIVKN